MHSLSFPLLVLLLSLAPGQAADYQASLRKVQDELAADGLGHLKWCEKSGLFDEAKKLGESYFLRHTAGEARRRLADAIAKIGKEGNAGDEKVLAELDKRIAGLRRKHSGSHAKLARFCREKKLAGECLGAITAALDIEQANPAVLDEVPAAWKCAIQAGCVWRAGRLLKRGLEIEKLRDRAQKDFDSIKDRLAKIEAEMRQTIDGASSSALIRTLKTHDLKHYLLLPENYDPEKSWPVVVTITGSGGVYDGEMSGWSPHRSRGYIVVCPVTISNTNDGRTVTPLPYPADLVSKKSADKIACLAWESEGLEKILDDLEEHYGADRRRVFLTGLSGGGNFAYHSIFCHPDRFAGVAPRNPNFHAQNLKFPSKPAPSALPIHIFTAADDEYKDSVGGSPGIGPQTRDALAQLKKSGYTNVKQTEVPGVKHNESSRYYGQIFDWFDSLQK